MTTRYLGDGIWARRTSLENSDIMIPVDVQGHHQELIQAHGGVAIAPTATGDSSSWIPCSGFDKIALTVKNSGAFASDVYIAFSNDGVNIEGISTNLDSTSDQYKAVEYPVCAQFFKVRFINKHTAPAIVTSSALLKA